MRSVDELAIVVELACQLGDRDRAEQRALANIAARVDRSRGLRDGTTNIGEHPPQRPYLLPLVVESCLTPVARSVIARWEKRLERWDQALEEVAERDVVAFGSELIDVETGAML